MKVRTKALEATECRRCCSFCDKLIDPAGCVRLNCRYLYQYLDERSGRRYMGCMQKIFEAEIDVELFAAARRRRGGFGGLKAAREPLSACEFIVERAYAGDGEAFRCVNQRFFDCSDVGPEAYRAADLRDLLAR